MKPQNRRSCFLVGVVLFLSTSSGLVVASGPAGVDVPAPASDWQIGIVDGTREVGYRVSIATDPETGHSYVSYYEGVDGDLWLARTGAPTGNCGPGNTWECQVVDSDGIVGKYSSIAVGGSGPVASLYISYHDVTNGSLKIVEGSVTRSTGALSFVSHVVEDGVPASGYRAGTATSITVDGSGNPHIGYQVETGGADLIIKYAERVTPGTGNCGVGADWECSPISTDDDIGDYIDIELDVGGVPGIAYYKASWDAHPVVATWVGTGGTCNSSPEWECDAFWRAGVDSGEYVSFAIGTDGRKHLAYRNDTTNSLEWTRYYGPGVGTNPFNREEIEVIGLGGHPSGIAIETDNDAEPIIVYRALESMFEELRIARPAGAAPWGGLGNCGTRLMISWTWFCETLDAGNSELEEAVGGLAIAVNANGEAAVAYRELYHPIATPAEGRLKVALEPSSLFIDGFGSGDTTAWDATVP